MMNKAECAKAKLCACSLGIAIGVTKGLILMLFAWAGWMWGVGTPMIEHIGNLFHGYAPTLLGGIIGGGWGLIGGFVVGLLIGWIYNRCICCGCKKLCGSCEKK